MDIKLSILSISSLFFVLALWRVSDVDAAQIPGGFQPVNPAESKVTDAAIKATGLLSETRHALFLLKLVKVKRASVQVVNGLLYRMKFVVGATSCVRDEEEEYEAAMARCAKTNDGDVWGSTQTCDVDVLLKPKTHEGGDREEEEKKEEEEKEVKEGEKDGEKPEVELEANLVRGNYDENCYYD